MSNEIKRQRGRPRKIDPNAFFKQWARYQAAAVSEGKTPTLKEFSAFVGISDRRARQIRKAHRSAEENKVRLLQNERHGGNKSKDDHRVVSNNEDPKLLSEKLPVDLAEKIRSAFNGRGPHQSIGLSIRGVILDWCSSGSANFTGRDLYQFVFSTATEDIAGVSLTPSQQEQKHHIAALAEATYQGWLRRKKS